MKKNLLLLLVFAMTTAGAFAQHAFNRESINQREQSAAAEFLTAKQQETPFIISTQREIDAQSEMRQLAEEAEQNLRAYLEKREKLVMQELNLPVRNHRETQKRDLIHSRAEISAFGTGRTHQLDSMFFYEFNLMIFELERDEKQTYRYDSHGRLIERISYFDLVDNEWTFALKSVYTYDIHGRVATLIRFYNENPGTGVWVPFRKYTYVRTGAVAVGAWEAYRTMYIRDAANDAWVGFHRAKFGFDANGNMILTTVWLWENNDWEELSKQVYTYDLGNNRTMQARYVWNNNDWEGEFRWRRAFDHVGNETLHTIYDWVNNDWEERIRHERIWYYTYDVYGRIIHIKSFGYCSQTGVVGRYQDKAYLGYDSNDNVIYRRVYSIVSMYTGEWIFYWRGISFFERVYDNDGNMLLEYSYLWNWVIEEWLVLRRITITYDSAGRILTAFVHMPDEQPGTWMETSRIINTFDSNGNLIEQIFAEFQFWTMMEVVTRQTSEVDTNITQAGVVWPHGYVEMLYNVPTRQVGSILFPGFGWIDAEAATFFYSEFDDDTTAIPDAPAASISIFPNPAVDSFVIDGIEENTLVSIADLSGRVVLQRTVSPNESISVSHLPAGIYIVRVNNTAQRLIVR